MRSFKFYTIFLITLLLLTSTAYSAQHKVFPFYDGTTGGTAGKLDNIDACDANGKGYHLQDQDVAMGADPTNGKYLIYTFDADSAAAEVDNTIIKPDECDGVAYTGDGRWILLVSSITSLDIEMGGEDYILMGEAGSPYNAEQIAPAAAIGALVDSVSGVIPTVMNYTEVTADNTLLTCAQMKNGIIYIKGAYNVILPDLATCNTTGMHGWITAWDADTITIEADADDNFTLNGTDLGDGDCATSDGTKGAFIEIFNPGLVSWRNLSQSNNPADGVSDWSDGGTCD